MPPRPPRSLHPRGERRLGRYRASHDLHRFSIGACHEPDVTAGGSTASPPDLLANHTAPIDSLDTDRRRAASLARKALYSRRQPTSSATRCTTDPRTTEPTKETPHTRRRRIILGFVAAAAAAAPLAFASPSTAAPAGSLRGLLLTGEGTCGFKTVRVAPQTPNLFAPVRLLGQDFSPTGKWLFPYEVDGHQRRGGGPQGPSPDSRRHLHPAGSATDDPVTCVFFTSASDEVGSFEVRITGPIRGTVTPIL